MRSMRAILHHCPPPLLAVAPFPKTDEHPGSYVRRVVEENGYDTIRNLMQGLGVISEADRFVGSTWQRIADATGIERMRMDPLDLEPHGRGASAMIEVDGTSVPAGFVDQRLLRSCPCCLAEDGYLPKRFAVRHMTACVRHGIALTDECVCGRRRYAFDRTFLWHCPTCGLDTAQMTSEPASRNQMLAARLMSTPSHEQPVEGVPSELILLPLSDRIAVIERLGSMVLAARDDEPAALTTGLTHHPIIRAPAARRLHQDRAIVEAAMSVLLDWPVSYRALLNDLFDPKGRSEAKSVLLAHFGTTAGRLALGKVVGVGGGTVEFIETEKLAFLREAIGYEPYWKTTPRANKGFAAAETKRVAGRMERLVNGKEFQRRLGYGKSETIAAWSRAGLIKTTVHPNGNAQLSRSDLDRLLSWFAALPVIDEHDERFVTFRSEVSRYSRGFYNRDELLRDVFNTAVRVGRLDDGTEGLRSLLLHKTDLARRRNLPKLIRWMATDAFIKSTLLFSVASPIWQIPPTSLRDVLDECRDILRTKNYPQGRWSYPLYSALDYVRELQRQTGTYVVRDDTVTLEAASADWRTVVIEDS